MLALVCGRLERKKSTLVLTCPFQWPQLSRQRVGAFSFLLDVYRKAHPQAKTDQSPPCCDRLSLISTVCQEEKHEGHVVIRFFFPETHDIRRIDIQSMTVDSPSWASPVQAHNVLRKVPIVP